MLDVNILSLKLGALWAHKNKFCGSMKIHDDDESKMIKEF